MICATCGYENQPGNRFCGNCAALIDTPSEPRSEVITTDNDFVGRQREMSELVAALDDAKSGRGRVIMLSGEPGIGKTRIAQEFANIAEEHGAEVLWGRCVEREGAPPYWPWLQMMRSYVADHAADQLVSEMGVGATDIAEIVPEVTSKIPDLHPSPQLDSPEQTRFRLFDSLSTFLRNASHTQPLVLIFDSLQWADKPSLLLLEFVARELQNARILVVGTYRDVDISRQHPLAETLGELSAESALQRVTLKGMEREDVRQFVQVASGFDPPDSLVDVVYSKTDGNPFFVTEVVRLLIRDGDLTKESADGIAEWSIRVPDGVRDVVGRRLNRLTEPCAQTLSTASVMGREFEPGHLTQMIEDFSIDRTMQMLGEAQAAGLIEESSSEGQYQFTHDLIQQMLYEEQSTHQRVMSHARIGRGLEDLYGDDADSHAAELSYHFEAARTTLGDDKFVHYSLVAGEQALSAHAYEAAETRFRTALDTKQGIATDEDTAALLFGLGRAQVATLPRHEMGTAITNLELALDYYVSTGDVNRAVAVAEYPFPPASGFTGFASSISRVLDMVPGDSHQAGRLLSRYGWVLGVEAGDYKGAQEAFDNALAIAQREHDLALELQTLTYSARVDGINHHWQESARKGVQASELANRAGDIRFQVDAHYRSAYALHVLGDLHAARLHATIALEMAEKLRDRYWIATALWMNEIVSRLAGDLPAAFSFSDRGLAVQSGDARLIGTRVLLEYEFGSIEQGEVYMARLQDAARSTAPGPTLDHANIAFTLPVVGRLVDDDSRLGVAEASANAIIDSQHVTVGMSNDARAALGLIAVQRGDVQEATEQYSFLKSEQGRLLFTTMAADRLLGLLARTMGEFTAAAAHFEDAVEFCRQAEYRQELAWSSFDYADLLVQRDAPGDLDRGTVLLEQALELSIEMGMGPLERRVTELQTRLDVRRKGNVYPDGLTPREVEVLRLVAAGKTNQEIADDLNIAVNTVNRHVSNAYDKTGSANRAQATAYVVSRGLMR